jgi:hypothetical protein
LVNLPHPTRAKRGEDFVNAEPGAGSERHGLDRWADYTGSYVGPFPLRSFRDTEPSRARCPGLRRRYVTARVNVTIAPNWAHR